MADILVRGLDARTVSCLKERAKRHGRSLQKEAQLVLELAAGQNKQAVAKVLKHWEEQFAGRRFSSSADLVREDRRR